MTNRSGTIGIKEAIKTTANFNKTDTEAEQLLMYTDDIPYKNRKTTGVKLK